jgi:beta-N-acetylhexosaminidase
MTHLEHLLLRCVFPGFEGIHAPDWVLRRAGEGLGGIVLFARNVETPEQLAALNAQLHAARPELLVAVDEEGGDVTRLEARTGSSYPGNLALGVADDVDLTRDVAAAMGARLAAAGVDLNLAPVADVNTNPQNPIIGVRSFGSDAKAAARHVAAWIEGMQAAGVAACAKHFPGHGDTSIDSHLALPVVDEDPHVRALEPFVSAIASDVRAIMSAHIVVRDLDTEPATSSPRLMTGVLRDELGFDGVAITDGLEMRGFTPDGDVGAGAVRALRAGCDALCVGGGLAGEATLDQIVRTVVAAIDEGRLGEARLREAASRVDTLAAWRAGRPKPAPPRREVGLEAARRAVRADGDVRVAADVVVLRFGSPPSLAAGEVPWGMADALVRRGARVTAVEAGSAAACDLAPLRQAGGRSLVLCVRDLHRQAGQAELLDRILSERPDAVVVEMGLPLCRPLRAAAYVATHGSARVCAEAAAEVLKP